MGIVPFQPGRGRGGGYVRFGSKADMCGAKRHVCFAPNSGHVQRKERCPLSARSRHSASFLLDALVDGSEQGRRHS